MGKQHPAMKVPNRMLIYRFGRKYEVQDTIIDTWVNSSLRRPRSARTKENIDIMTELLLNLTKKKIPQMCPEWSRYTCSTFVNLLFINAKKILNTLKLIPYTKSKMQHLKETNIRSPLEFAQWFLMKPDSENVKMQGFLDEAFFHLR